MEAFSAHGGWAEAVAVLLWQRSSGEVFITRTGWVGGVLEAFSAHGGWAEDRKTHV